MAESGDVGRDINVIERPAVSAVEPRAPKSPDRFTRLVLVLARTLIGGVFLAAGVSKFGVDSAVGSMFWSFFPKGSVLAYAMIGTEIALGLWLISGFKTRISTIIAAGMLVAYSIAIGHELTKSDPNPCGCMVEILPSTDPEMIKKGLMASLVRNLALLACCVVVWALTPPRAIQKQSGFPVVQ